MKDIELWHGDCLELMKNIEDKSIDLILCDLPYGTTACKWDVVIPFDKLWEQYNRIIKEDGVIVLFGIQPFTTMLISSNVKLFRYSWIWVKDSPTGFLNCNYRPLQSTEDIVVFSNGKVGSLSKKPIRYYPQGLSVINKEKTNRGNSTWREKHGYLSRNNKLNSNEVYIQKYTGYPDNLLSFSREKNAIHPTQKPVALLEYLIKTYTNENDLVLDNTMGSGSTGVACVNTNRRFIGIEKDEKFFEIAKDRILKQ